MRERGPTLEPDGLRELNAEGVAAGVEGDAALEGREAAGVGGGGAAARAGVAGLYGSLSGAAVSVGEVAVVALVVAHVEAVAAHLRALAAGLRVLVAEDGALAAVALRVEQRGERAVGAGAVGAEVALDGVVAGGAQERGGAGAGETPVGDLVAGLEHLVGGVREVAGRRRLAAGGERVQEEPVHAHVALQRGGPRAHLAVRVALRPLRPPVEVARRLAAPARAARVAQRPGPRGAGGAVVVRPPVALLALPRAL